MGLIGVDDIIDAEVRGVDIVFSEYRHGQIATHYVTAHLLLEGGAKADLKQLHDSCRPILWCRPREDIITVGKGLR